LVARDEFVVTILSTDSRCTAFVASLDQVLTIATIEEFSGISSHYGINVFLMRTTVCDMIVSFVSVNFDGSICTVKLNIVVPAVSMTVHNS